MDIPPAQDSPQNILNVLDDDCIRLIIRQLFLIDDILNAAEVCTRFQDSAKNYFRSKYKQIGINVKTKSFGNLTHEQSQRILRNFGDVIDSIEWMSTDDRERNEKTFKAIAKYCGKTLKELEVKNFQPGYMNLLYEQTRFEKLHKLSLFRTSPQSFRLDSPLKTLIISHMELNDPKPWFVRKFLDLRHIEFEWINNLTNSILIEFLSLNPQLHGLELNNCSGMSQSMLEIFEQYAIDLQHLKIVTFTFLTSSKNDSLSSEKQANIITPLAKLSNLRSLDLRKTNIFSLEGIFEVFAEKNVPIETLIFSPVKQVVVTKDIPNLKNLKHLRIDGNVLTETLDNIVNTQPALKKIQIEIFLQSSELLNSSTYYLSHIKERNYDKNLFELTYHVLRGNIDLSLYEFILGLAKNCALVNIELGHGNRIFVQKDVLQANQNWLNIVL